jgi:hypothetical protein
MDDCIEWGKARNNCGYGLRWYKGKVWKAHRAALDELGTLDPEKHVLHTCDNRACVNPNHLVQGSHQDNMADMRAKGRTWYPFLEFNGQKKTVPEWAKELGITRRALLYRLERMSVEEALTMEKYAT